MDLCNKSTGSWYMIILMYCWICFLIFCWGNLHLCPSVMPVIVFYVWYLCLVLVSGWYQLLRMSIEVLLPMHFWNCLRNIDVKSSLNICWISSVMSSGLELLFVRCFFVVFFNYWFNLSPGNSSVHTVYVFLVWSLECTFLGIFPCHWHTVVYSMYFCSVNFNFYFFIFDFIFLCILSFYWWVWLMVFLCSI